MKTASEKSFASEIEPKIPGGWMVREYSFPPRSIKLLQPADPDAFLEDAAIHARHEQTGYMPYWAYLWPASLKMVAWMLTQHWPTGTRGLELGAGIGQTGVAGLMAGLQVTFTDYEPLAVELCLKNAALNGFTPEAATGLVLDWRDPPDDQYPVIFGSEVTYEDQNHEPLLKLLRRMLAPLGTCWLGDAGRTRSEHFLRRIPEFGFSYRLRNERHEPLPAPQFGQFQLIEIFREETRLATEFTEGIERK